MRTDTRPARITVGHEVAQALLALNTLSVHPRLSILAVRGQAANIRRTANEWFTQHRKPYRVEVYRTQPNAGLTYVNTEWEVRLVKKDSPRPRSPLV